MLLLLTLHDSSASPAGWLSVSGFVVEPFGVFLGAGLLLAVLLATRLADRVGLLRARGASLFVAAGAGALPAARGLYVLSNGVHESGWQALAFGVGGLSGYGALLGAVAGALWVSRRWRPEARGSWFDCAAPGVVLAAATARLGCFLSGCDFGVTLGARAPRWLARLGTFERGAPDALRPVWLEQLQAGQISANSLESLPSHPTQLYEAILLLAFSVYLMRRIQLRTWAGQIFAQAVLGYAVIRGALELLRADADRGRLVGISVTSWCALLTAAWALSALWRRRARLADSAQSPPELPR